MHKATAPGFKTLPNYSPLLKKACVRQVALDKWFPLIRRNFLRTKNSLKTCFESNPENTALRNCTKKLYAALLKAVSDKWLPLNVATGSPSGVLLLLYVVFYCC